MNITELARKLKIPTSELKDLLPRLGFDIGRKAIKIDDQAAHKIIENFKTNPHLVTRLRQESQPTVTAEVEKVSQSTQTLTIPSVITVRDFAALLNKPVAAIIQELMKNGILANLNEQIDYETAGIIAQDFGFKTTPQKEETAGGEEEATLERLLVDDQAALQERPPVVVVMGHVDHGKTKLLDTIRKTNVTAQEAGGITQHIGAYQVTKNGRTITFIDTPGHEAFTTMRSRGARIADIAILVVAADEGLKPQTEEAIKIIENAKLPFLVAINKIDKPEADVEKIKQQLAQKNLLPEDWGGKIICVPVSAKNGQGIDDLLEHLLLLADVEKENIQANPNRPAIGIVIESHVDKGEGPVAIVIVQTGTLRRGDAVQVGQVVGRIRALKDFTGKEIAEATPSMPIKLLGLKSISEVGDILQVTAAEQSLKKIRKKLEHQQKMYQLKQNWQTVRTKKGGEKEKKKSVNIILKTDTLGSQEAITQSLETLATENVKVAIVKKGLGNITDIDVLQAESASAHPYGFNVKVSVRAQEMATEKNIAIATYDVIYNLIDAVKKEIAKLISYKVEIVELGRAKVLAIFRTEKAHMIIGALVTKGKLEPGAKANIERNSQIVGQEVLEELQQAKQKVSSVPAGSECGVQLSTHAPVQIGDFLEVYKEELKK